MTDVNAGEAPIEPVPPVPPEIPPDAAAAPEVETPVSVEIDAALPSADARAAALEIEYPIGATRQAILDHFLDSDSPEQSMSQIKAGLPNVLPGTVEAAVPT
jgi:hypothetical protein